MVVINDAWTANDLLEKRADKYSSMPSFSTASRWNQTTKGYSMTNHEDRWRLYRNLTVRLVMSSWLSSKATSIRLTLMRLSTLLWAAM